MTLDRLAGLSPRDLKRLGARLREHDAGEFILDMISVGYQQRADEPLLPLEEGEE